MANEKLPSYLTSARPNPIQNRAPWFKTTAQTYAGIFLWIAFYDQLAGTIDGPGALGMAGWGTCLVAFIVAGLISYALFYLVPGMLGMKTGYPLYIVGTSTFGTKGGYFIPGIFMGLLQIGWYSVATFYATKLVLGGFLLDRFDNTLFGPTPLGGENAFSLVFVVLAVVWGYLFAFFGGLGINMVAKLSTYFPIVPIVMLIVGAAIALGQLKNYDRESTVKNSIAALNVLKEAETQAKEKAENAGNSDAEAKNVGVQARKKLAKEAAETTAIEKVKISEDDQKLIAGLKLPGFLLVVNLVIGFFATAGAVGADVCSSNRDERDVRLGGLVGITLATIFAGGLAIITVAGAHGILASQLADGKTEWGQLVNYSFSGALPIVSPALGRWMLILFAIGSIAPACFCSFVIGNSLSTMLARPKARVPITMAGATIGIALAALGVAGNLGPFFGLIGASFGPVIGAMCADYLLSGKKWAGPREGISIPGYAAWLIGFIVGICNNAFVTKLIGTEILPDWHPTGVYSFIVGFVVYVILAKAGLEGNVVKLKVGPQGGPSELQATASAQS